AAVVAGGGRPQAAAEREVQAVADPAPLPLIAPQARVEGHPPLLLPAAAAASVLLRADEEIAHELDDAEVLTAGVDLHRGDTGAAWSGGLCVHLQVSHNRTPGALRMARASVGFSLSRVVASAGDV